MKLQFSIRKIDANPTLRAKFRKLQKNQFVHRIYAQFVFIKPDETESYRLQGIIDTGAITSLFPLKFLDYYPAIITEDHTLWGIVDSPDCQIQAKLGVIDIKLIDKNANKSKKLSILAAFSSYDNIPILLGMKDLLATYSSSINIKELNFEIVIS